jgi:predicted helicase
MRPFANNDSWGRVPAFDLVVADEAHRIAGPVSSDFATVLDQTAIKARRRLFMTATPRYFTGRVLKAAQAVDFEVASMDDRRKFGLAPMSPSGHLQ